MLPTFFAGHSLGEYSALVCAGVFSLTQGVKLVEKRGEYMQACVPAGVGAMAAVIGLDDQAIIDACAESQMDEVVAAVNFNSPGQVVICLVYTSAASDEEERVDRGGALCIKRRNTS